MPVIPVTADQLPAALRRRVLRRLGQVLAETSRVADIIVVRGRQMAIAEDLVAFRVYSESFEKRMVPNGVNVDNSAPHADIIEFGRRPGAPGPPVAAIQAWMDVKGIEGSARAIARAIHRRGLRPKRLMQRLARWGARRLRVAVAALLRRV